MADIFDSIVIGVGAMGSATVYELAKAGQKVLGIEQFDIPHAFGSSHGLTRMIRMAYVEPQIYVPLLKRTYELWHEIENRSGRKLLHVTGGLDMSAPDGQIFTSSRDACAQFGMDHEVLDAGQAMSQFPALNIPDHFMVNYQPDAGFLMSEDAISTYVNEAHKLGAKVHGREKMLNWQEKKIETENGVIDAIEVKTVKGTYLCKKLIITAGAWAGKMISEIADVGVYAERQVLIWMHPNDPKPFEYGNLPVWVVGDGEQIYYGFPTYDVPGLKFGLMQHLKEKVDPDEMGKDIHIKDEQILRNFAYKYFPDATGPTMALRTCMFTNTPDKHFIIDHHPQNKNVIFGAGFSGHGFKFASVMGEIFAQMAINGHTDHDISAFKLSRFH